MTPLGRKPGASAIVTLLTDFGTADYFVGAMKGVILSIAPGVTLVDVTHEVPPQEVRSGAFILLAAYREFPPGTVHVAIVDPGVGSSRRGIAIEAGGYRFVGPDNGIFGWIVDREPDARVFHLSNRSLFRPAVSSTFHGRDVFAPVAAALAAGMPIEQVGDEIGDFARMESLRPVRGEGGELRGAILHVDRFGNCVTSFTREDLPVDAAPRGFHLAVGERDIRSLRRFYAEETGPGRVFAIWGSAGFLELSANRDSAARLLSVRPGDPVALTVG